MRRRIRPPGLHVQHPSGLSLVQQPHGSSCRLVERQVQHDRAVSQQDWIRKLQLMVIVMKFFSVVWRAVTAILSVSLSLSVCHAMTQVDVQVEGTARVRYLRDERATQEVVLSNRRQPFLSPYLAPISQGLVDELFVNVERVHDLGVTFSVLNQSGSTMTFMLHKANYASVARSKGSVLTAHYWVGDSDGRRISDFWTAPSDGPSVLLPGHSLNVRLGGSRSVTSDSHFLGLEIDNESSKITSSSLGGTISISMPVTLRGQSAQLEINLKSIAEFQRQVYR